MSNPAYHDLAILSLNGRPLVRLSESARSDDIRHDWQRVRGRIKSILKSDARTLAEWTAEFEPYRGKSEMADCILAMLPSLAPYIEGCARRKIPAFVPVRPLGFKFLRKTASNLIRKLENKDTAEVFLAHVDPTVGRHYHNPDFKRLNRGLRKFHDRIWPAAAVEPAPKPAE